MMLLGMTLLVLQFVVDDNWSDAIETFLVVHPIQAGDGENDHIAVVLNAKLCHHEMCAGT